MSKITKEEIKKIAALAKLEFDESEISAFENEFNSILNYVSMIKECDTSDIEFEHNMKDYSGTILQPDIVKSSLPIEKVLMNASEDRTKGKFIKTKRSRREEE